MLNKVHQQKEHFNQVSRRYYTSRQAATHRLLKSLMWRYFFNKKKYLRKSTLTVLELMCGYGEGKKIVDEAMDCDCVYEGFDSCAELVETTSKSDNRIKIWVDDATTFKPKKRYDLVLIIGGLHHVPSHVSQVLHSARGCLKSDGYLVVLEPTHNNWLFRKIRQRIYRKNSLFDNETEQAFELSKLNNHFQRSELTIVDQTYPGLLSYVLYYNPDAFPWLNRGGEKLVKFIFSLDKLFFRSIIGRKLSFATLSLLKGNS